MQEFECFGYWWIPNKPDFKLPGSLKFSHEEGANLNVWGEFEDKLPDLIYGQTNNDLITLVKCQLMGEVKKLYNPKVGHTTSSEYNAEIIFLGKHLKDILDNLKFFKVHLDITYLSKWACLSRFEQVNDQDFMTIKPIIGEEIKVNLNNLKLSIDDGELLLIDSELTVGQYCRHSIIDRGLEAKNTFYSSFILKFKPALSYQDMYDLYFIPLQGFLTFMTNRANYLVKIEIFEDDNSDIPIQVFVPQIQINLNKQNNNIPEILTLIHLRQVKDRFETIIKSWFDLYQTMSNIMNLYLIIKYNQLLTIENKFLFLAQLLEGYHKLKIKKKGSYYDRILFCVKESQFIIFDTLFKNDNYYDEKNKLDFFEKLTKLITDNRNYYTHYSKEENTIIFNGIELLILSKTMDLLFQVIILKSFEFSDEEIQKMILPKPEYYYLQQKFQSLHLTLSKVILKIKK